MTVLIALVLAPFFALTSCFALEVLLGLRPLKLSPIRARGGGDAVIVVPAHDEAALLQQRLAVLSEAAKGRAQILLVADNCSDNTAEIARRLGIETIERCDPDRRGKGFALDFARRHLKAKSPSVVIIVDADCTIDSESLGRLIARCVETGNPQQATNLQLPSPQASPSVQLSTFAFYIKNVIRQRALQRISGRVNLLGTGMAFPWATFAEARLATSNIVEDLKLGQELAAVGHSPLFAEDATVWSAAETDRNTLSQRSRWEGGFLRNALIVSPRFLLQSFLCGDGAGVWAAVNLMIPPFALLILIDLMVSIIAALVAWSSGLSQWPVFLLTGSFLGAIAALALAWAAAGGHRFVSAGSLIQAPLYVLWKLPMYLGFLRKGTPNEWMRTQRGES